MKLAPWVLVPATSSVFSLPGMAIHPFAMLVFAAIGLIAGFYLSVIAAAVLEWMALVLISLETDNTPSESDDVAR